MQATLITVAVTLLITLFGAVWHLSALASKLSEIIRQHKEDIDDLRKNFEPVKTLPVFDTRLGQVEQALTKLVSIVPKLDSRIGIAESKLISLREYRTPFRSKPDFGDKEE